MTTRIIVGWLLACMLGAPLSASAGLPTIGQPPPDVTGLMPDGATYRISEQRGKVVVMAFWASWCGYCRKYTPVLEGLQRQVGKDQLDVVLVNFKEDARTYRTLRRHLAGHGLTPEEYRARYGLKPDYPMVAASYSEARRAMAKKIGLGRKAGKTAEGATAPKPRAKRG